MGRAEHGDISKLMRPFEHPRDGVDGEVRCWIVRFLDTPRSGFCVVWEDDDLRSRPGDAAVRGVNNKRRGLTWFFLERDNRPRVEADNVVLFSDEFLSAVSHVEDESHTGASGTA